MLCADDLAILARTKRGLQALLYIVKNGFDKLNLEISVEKSQVISPEEDEWVVTDENDMVTLSLDQVSLYKYLGTWTYNSMFKTAVEKQKLCVKTANKYRGACKLVSSNGPDLCDVVKATWCDFAVNS